MGRDFTPKELYYAEKEISKQSKRSYFDLMEGMTVTVDGKTSPVYSPEVLQVCKQYPILGRLVNPPEFVEAHSALSKISGGLDILAQKEKELSLYISTGIHKRNSVVVSWFEGRLDPSFYYGERNEELFLASLQEEAAARQNSPLTERIQDAKTQSVPQSTGKDGPKKAPGQGR